MKVGFFLLKFPLSSETFVLNQIRAAQRCKRLAPENGICVVVCGTKNKEEVLTHDR